MLAALTVPFFPHPEPFTSFWIPYAQHQFEQISHVLAAWQEDEGSAFNENKMSYRHRGASVARSESGLVMENVNAKRVTVSSTDWLDVT